LIHHFDSKKLTTPLRSISRSIDIYLLCPPHPPGDLDHLRRLHRHRFPLRLRLPLRRRLRRRRRRRPEQTVCQHRPASAPALVAAVPETSNRYNPAPPSQLPLSLEACPAISAYHCEFEAQAQVFNNSFLSLRSRLTRSSLLIFHLQGLQGRAMLDPKNFDELPSFICNGSLLLPL
jgi:hypothetical protein